MAAPPSAGRDVRGIRCAEVNDNDAVAEFYARVLRPIAEDFRLAVVLLHHERKVQAGGNSGPAGHNTMGARYWIGGADMHVILAAASKFTATELDADDPRDPHATEETYKEFKLEVAKGRDGYVERTLRTAVRGLRDEHGRLLELRVESLGYEADSDQQAFERQIVGYLAGRPDEKHKRKDVAQALGQTNPSDPGGTFKRAWKAVQENGRAQRVGQALQITQAGLNWFKGEEAEM